MPIQILPAQLANQIAAGEVVERPASVVKELMENCLDADAKKVSIEIDKGGHKRILVRDDGKGIGKEELQLALSRHATSKIQSLADLEAIACLGFRGEALASISSVSRLTLTSKPEMQEQAWQALAEGRDMQVTLLPVAHPKGSSVEVLDLFFNTPARRKFLRAEKTEFAHVEEVVKRVALSRFDVGFALKHNGKLVKNLPAIKSDSDPFARVQKLCGNDFAQHAIEVKSDYQSMYLKGWIAGPGYVRKQNDLQYFYLNGRVIRDKLVNHAIRQSLEGCIEEGGYPAFVLYLTLPAEDVDVNVHPSKHEVRFHQARLVHDFILSAISDVFSLTRLEGFERQSLDAEPTHNYIRPLQQASNQRMIQESGPAEFSSNSRSGETHSNRASSSVQYTGRQSSISQTAATNYQSLMRSQQTSAATQPASDINYIQLPGQRLLLEFQHAYYLINLSSLGLAQLQHQWQNHPAIAQPLLMPVSIQADKPFIKAAQNLYDNLLHWGIELGWNDKRILLRKVPAGCRNLAWAEVLPSLLVLPQDFNLAALFNCFNQVSYQLDHQQVSAALGWLHQQDEAELTQFIQQFDPTVVPLMDILAEYDN